MFNDDESEVWQHWDALARQREDARLAAERWAALGLGLPTVATSGTASCSANAVVFPRPAVSR